MTENEYNEIIFNNSRKVLNEKHTIDDTYFSIIDRMDYRYTQFKQELNEDYEI